MIVHFTASTIEIDKKIEDFRLIAKKIHEHGHSIAQDWIEPAFLRSKRKKEKEETDQKLIFSENMSAIARADVMIVEASVHSTGLGYQIAIAMQQKKPILLLRRSDFQQDSFIWSLEEPVVDKAEYNEKNIEKLLEDFFEKNDIKSKDMRFNFFIDRQIYNYLRWASQKTNRTKAEILRELVLREIDKDKEI